MENSPIETAAAAVSLASFTACPNEFHKAAAWLAGQIVDRRATAPVLASIHLAASPDGFVTLTASDLDVWASLQLPAVVETPGLMAIDACSLRDTLAKLAKDKSGIAEFSLRQSDTCRAVLARGRARFNLSGHDPAAFPLAPIERMAGMEALPAQFTAPAARFLSDMKALAPCMGKDDRRTNLEGVSVETRDMGEGPALHFVATDGHVLSVAAREAQEGMADFPGAIIPAKAVNALAAAAKLAGVCCGAAVIAFDPVAFNSGCAYLAIGSLTMASKLIDGTFPDWTRLVSDGGALAPTGEETGCMFPELLPGAPTGAMDRAAKGCSAAIKWSHAKGGMIGTVAGDPGLFFGAVNGRLQDTGRKGFTFALQGEQEAQEYLLALAESRGLPSFADLQARCDAITAEYGEPDNAACNGLRPFGHAVAMEPATIIHGGRVVALTVMAQHKRAEWSETVKDWEALIVRQVYHPETVEALEGSYSLLMPADGPGKLSAVGDGEIVGPDGHAYPVAINDRGIHLSKEQVRALMGHADNWAVVEFPGTDGKPRYVAKWLWEQGDSRLLLVGKDGRCFPESRGRVYVSREQVEAALAGEAVELDAPAAVAERESAPEACRMPEIEPVALDAPEIAPAEPVATVEPVEPTECAPVDDSGEAAGDPVEAILARLDALEAAIARGQTAPLSGESSTAPTGEAECAVQIGPRRTPAHERAIRRAWSERKARRYWNSRAESAGGKRRDNAQRARRMVQSARHAAAIERRCANTLAAQLDQAGEVLNSSSRKRRASTILARQRGREMAEITRVARLRLDETAQELQQAKQAPVYFDCDGRERGDIAATAFHYATVAREGRERTETALAAMAARAERAEQARDTLADAVEAMGTRLANAEAAVRRMAAA